MFTIISNMKRRNPFEIYYNIYTQKINKAQSKEDQRSRSISINSKTSGPHRSLLNL